MTVNLEKIAIEEWKLDEFFEALSEVTGVNAQTFMRMLKMYMEKPDNKKLEAVNIDNTKTALKSLDELYDSKYIVGDEEYKQLYEIMKVLESYFIRYGYSSGKLGSLLRKLYKRIHAYLDKVAKTYPQYKKKKYTDEQVDQLALTNPNTVYLHYYHKYQKELLDQVNRGEAPSLPEIKGKSDLASLKTMAKEDALRWIKTGEDYSKSRGNLEYAGFGIKTLGQLSDELMLEGVRLLEKDETQKHLRAIKQIDGIKEEELSEPQWLFKYIDKELKRR